MDDKAFEILVMEHHRRLLAYAQSLIPRRDIAEDLVQDAFLVAYRRLSDFDSARSFGAWVRGIVRNKYLEYVRRNREFATDPQKIFDLDRQHEEWDDSEGEPGGALAALSQCVKKLPEPMCEVVNLFYFKQMAGEDAAEVLNLNHSTIRKRLQRAREWLGGCVRRHLQEQAT